jgi:hypothetical protein
MIVDWFFSIFNPQSSIFNRQSSIPSPIAFRSFDFAQDRPPSHGEFSFVRMREALFSYDYPCSSSNNAATSSAERPVYFIITAESKPSANILRVGSYFSISGSIDGIMGKMFE